MKLERIAFFPVRKTHCKAFRYEAIIGLGGNEGDVKKRFVALYRRLLDDRRFHVRETSPVLENPPFGYTEQNDFHNAVMILETSLHVKALLKILLHVEDQFGRVRRFKNGPRTLDLDIIFFDNLKRNQHNLIVPHPRWSERLSVVVPLFMLKSFKG